MTFHRYSAPFLRFIVVMSLMVLAACGFQPVYGGSGGVSPVSEELSLVAIDPMPNRAGQMLRNDLIDRMYGKAGRPSHPAYHLSVNLRIVEEDLGTLANATTALAALHAYGDYVLTDTSGKVLTKGATASTAQYDKLTSQYSTLAAHDNAVERTVREVSEQLTARLGLYFAERPGTSETKKP